MKPGYKTTEYWLSVVVVVLGLLASSGLFGPDHWAAKAIALVTSALAAMGYTASRAKVKQADSLGKPESAAPPS